MSPGQKILSKDRSLRTGYERAAWSMGYTYDPGGPTLSMTLSDSKPTTSPTDEDTEQAVLARAGAAHVTTVEYGSISMQALDERDAMILDETRWLLPHFKFVMPLTTM